MRRVSGCRGEGTFALVRAMFTLYWAIIAAGIILYAGVGLIVD
jgi:hypothetical protein